MEGVEEDWDEGWEGVVLVVLGWAGFLPPRGLPRLVLFLPLLFPSPFPWFLGESLRESLPPFPFPCPLP